MKPVDQKPYWGLIKKQAEAHGVNPYLVMALCEKESALDTYAMRYEPGWRWFLHPIKWAKRVRTTEKTERVGQSISWGLGQVMGTVARERGFRDDFPRLCLPQVGVMYVCIQLRWLFEQGLDTPTALAAYNAGLGNRSSKVGKAYAAHVLEIMDGYLRGP